MSALQVFIGRRSRRRRTNCTHEKTEFFTPEWFDAFRHAASEADRLGLEMTIFSSAGWSETGGPWVKPEQAMKKLVWQRCRYKVAAFNGVLPRPPSENSRFQNIPNVRISISRI